MSKFSDNEGKDNMTTKKKEPKAQVDDRDIEKEIAALIQVVNGLNEVYEDDAKFERVYKYIEMRYEEKVKAKRESVRNAFVMVVLKQCEQLEAALVKVRRMAEAENPDFNEIVVIIDACLKEVKGSDKRNVPDVNDYRMARKREAS
jgi:hypothetical protein